MALIGNSRRNIHDFLLYLYRNPAGMSLVRNILGSNPLVLGGEDVGELDVKIWSYPTSPPPADADDFPVASVAKRAKPAVTVGDFCFTGDGGIYVCSDATAGALVWDEVGGAAAPPVASGAKVTLSVDATIPDDTETIVNFDTEVFDTDGYHEGVTNPSRLTVPAGGDGIYTVEAYVEWVAPTASANSLAIKKNGSIVALTRIPIGSNGVYSHNIPFTDELVEDDYIQVEVWQDSGSPVDIVTASYLAIIKH